MQTQIPYHTTDAAVIDLLDLSTLRAGLRLLIAEESAKAARGEVIGIRLARFEDLSVRLTRAAQPQCR